MSTRPCIAIGLAVLLAGCQRTQPADAPIPGLGAGDSQAVWGGTLPCADCEGIDTQIALRRQGGEQRYRMIEVYMSEDSNARFVEQGKWSQEQAGRLRLQGDEGAQHVFAVVGGGRLQPRDATGRPFLGRDADLLLPLRPVPVAP